MKTLYAVYSLFLVAVLSITSSVSPQKTAVKMNVVDCCNNKPKLEPKKVNWQDSLNATRTRLARKMAFSDKLLKKLEK